MDKPNDKITYRFIVAMCSVLLYACSSDLGKESTGFWGRLFDPESYKPYRIDITQGNILERSKVAQLKPGMTKDQVVYLLGYPLMPTVFHDDRWDYVYYNNVLRQTVDIYRLTLFFDGDRVERLRKTKNLLVEKPQKTKK